MSTIVESAFIAPPPLPQPSQELARGALGLKQVLFCIVIGAAPMAAILFNVPTAVLSGGSGAPATFLIAYGGGTRLA